MVSLSRLARPIRWIALLLIGFAIYNLGAEGVRLATGQTQWQRLPSSYDPGISFPQAARAPKGLPLLVEFYADRCLTCRKVTPMVHTLLKEAGWDQCLTWLMVDVDKPENADYVGLFGVGEIPRLFIFWPQQMKQQTILIDDTPSPPELTLGVQTAWRQLGHDAPACSALQ